MTKTKNTKFCYGILIRHCTLKHNIYIISVLEKSLAWMVSGVGYTCLYFICSNCSEDIAATAAAATSNNRCVCLAVAGGWR